MKNIKLHAYQQILPEIQAAGATLVAITPELPDESFSTSERHHLEFEVLTDKNSDYAREFGLVFTIQESLHSFEPQRAQRLNSSSVLQPSGGQAGIVRLSLPVTAPRQARTFLADVP